jgi:hypothetical protein
MRGNEKSQPETLHPTQLRVIELRASGMSRTATARAVGCDRVTIHRWETQNPAFRAALAERAREIHEELVSRLGKLRDRCVTVLEECLADGQPNHPVRLQACRIVLSFLSPSDAPPPPVEAVKPRIEIPVTRHRFTADQGEHHASNGNGTPPPPPPPPAAPPPRATATPPPPPPPLTPSPKSNPIQRILDAQNQAFREFVEDPYDDDLDD